MAVARGHARVRIWIVNYTALPPSEPGGTRHYSLGRELQRRGHDVLILASNFHYVARRQLRLADGNSHQSEEIGGVPFHWLRAPSYDEGQFARVWSWLVFSWRVWREEGLRDRPLPDVVLGSSPYPFAAVAAERLAERHEVPFILEVRDLWPQTLIDLGQYSRVNPFIVALDLIERYLYRRADRIVSLLPEAGEYMAAKGAVRDRVDWIPNGVDLELYPDPDPPEDGGPFSVMYAGAHGLSNTLDLVLDAAGILQDDGWGPDRAVFRLVGDGPYKPRLRERSDREGLQNVLFDDPVPKERIGEVLRQADAFVRPLEDSPLYRWGASPNKLFDYMASARPVIYATASGTNPVEESGGGIAIPPGDPEAIAEAVKQLAGLSATERWEMGLRGRRHVENHYAFPALTGRLERTLRSAAADPR